MLKYIPAIAIALALLSCNPAPSAQESTPVAKTPENAFKTRFDRDLAWDHLEKQLDFGFRVPGSTGHKNCRGYLQEQLLKYCDTVEEQAFTKRLPRGMTEMYNIIGRFNLDSPRRIILAAHWDTRPTADNNPAGKRNQPIAGANDGASGVAVLLELARVFSTSPPPVGVDIVLFDGEDFGPSTDMMFFGSKYFANSLSEAQAKSYNYGILLDMIGDKDLDIHPELNSEAVASHVYSVAAEVSRNMGYMNFKKSGSYEIEDDHVFLIERGVRMYDFIDFNYPNFPTSGRTYWHTTEDTADKCSSKSLECVGRVVEYMVYKFPDLYAPDA